MSEPKALRFRVVSSGRDEYPGDGLRIALTDAKGEPDPNAQFDKHFLYPMGLELRDGDEIEITARIISRVVTERRPL